MIKGLTLLVHWPPTYEMVAAKLGFSATIVLTGATPWLATATETVALRTKLSVIQATIPGVTATIRVIGVLKPAPIGSKPSDHADNVGSSRQRSGDRASNAVDSGNSLIHHGNNASDPGDNSIDHDHNISDQDRVTIQERIRSIYLAIFTMLDAMDNISIPMSFIFAETFPVLIVTEREERQGGLK